MKLLVVMMMLVSVSAQADDHSVGIAPDGLHLYAIRDTGPTPVGSAFATPSLDQNPLTPVNAAMNTAHDFVYVL